MAAEGAVVQERQHRENEPGGHGGDEPPASHARRLRPTIHVRMMRITVGR
jgi:hypothetical protein